MKNFDRFIGIDWSGAKSPVLTNSIAVAVAEKIDIAPQNKEEPWSRSRVADFLFECANGTVRTLAGIDCNFGYSESIGEKQFGKNYTAYDLWQAVEDSNEGEANYFAGGYWTHERHGAHFWRSGTMPEGFSMPRRATEQACGESGLGWPESPFKLIGAKQVGKGGLAGMRLIYDLKRRLGQRIAIWPFDAHVDEAALVIAEIYPRLFLRMAGHGNAKIRNLSELNATLSALQIPPIAGNKPFSDHQADAIVSAAGLRLLCGRGNTVPEGFINPSIPRKTLLREGWIFGVQAKR